MAFDAFFLRAVLEEIREKTVKELSDGDDAESLKKTAETRSGDDIAEDVISKITGGVRSAPLGEVKKNK